MTHGSTSQKTILNFILAAVRTLKSHTVNVVDGDSIRRMSHKPDKNGNEAGGRLNNI
jgi:hypothetical protein